MDNLLGSAVLGLRRIAHLHRAPARPRSPLYFSPDACDPLPSAARVGQREIQTPPDTGTLATLGTFSRSRKSPIGARID